MEPQKNAQKRLRAELSKLYVHLDGSASGPIDVNFFRQRTSKLKNNCKFIYFEIGF